MGSRLQLRVRVTGHWWEGGSVQVPKAVMVKTVMFPLPAQAPVPATATPRSVRFPTTLC